jgi:regulatory protein
MRTRRYQRSKPKDPIPLDGSAAVSSIRICSDDPARVTLCVDRQHVGRILIETKSKHDIQVGTSWTEDLSESLQPELDRGNAYRAAVRILSKRAKSSEELRRKLREYKYASDGIQWSIDRLTELGVLNDEEYARAVVRSQLRRKPAGRRFLSGKLREKGIHTSVIDIVLDELLDERDPFDDALELAQKADRSMSKHLSSEVRMRRISGRLARRGFDFDVIRRVLERLD